MKFDRQGSDGPAASTAAEALRYFSAEYSSRFAVPAPTGRPTVGYLSNNVPVELVRAAGCDAVRIWGNPAEHLTNSAAYMEDCFDGDLRAVFERFLQGAFANFSLVIIPHASEGLLQLYYYLNEMQRRDPNAGIPSLYLFDILHTPYQLTARYVRDQVERLARRLEALTKQLLPSARVQGAIQTSQRRIAAYERLSELRIAQPAQLTGTQALEIYGSAGSADPETHLHAVETLLRDRTSTVSHSACRVMVKGSPQYSLDLYRLIEVNGAVIVADDHLTGDLGVGGPFDESLEPLASIAHRYHRRSPSIRSFPQAASDAKFESRLTRFHIGAVVFCYEDTDDTYGWEYPDQKAILDRLGIASLLLLNQPFRGGTQSHTSLLVKTFFGELKARSHMQEKQ
jgi:benzoyl-CoA reductase subunit C